MKGLFYVTKNKKKTWSCFSNLQFLQQKLETKVACSLLFTDSLRG